MTESTFAKGNGLHWSDASDLQQKLEKAVNRVFPRQILSLSIHLEGDFFTVSGQVASESCRSFTIRTLLRFDGVFKYVDLLEVTAFLQAAGYGRKSWPSGSFDKAVEGAVSAGRSNYRFGGMIEGRDGTGDIGRQQQSRSSFDGGSSARRRRRSAGSVADRRPVSRHPSIELEGAAAAGATVTIVVDLAAIVATGTEGDPIELGYMPTGWTRMEVGVVLAATGLSKVDPPQCSIVLLEDGTSLPARFECTLVDDAASLGDTLQITAIFMLGTRMSGTGTRTFTVAATDPEERPGPMGLAPLAFDRQSPGPTLTITINDLGDGHQRWNWSSTPRSLIGDLAGIATLGRDPASFTAELLARAPFLDPLSHRLRMRSIGERLWRVSPDAFQRTYLDLRSRLGSSFPIQLLTDDRSTP